MIQYPDYLPCFERQGYDMQTASPLLRSTMQSGRSRQRRQYLSTPTYVTASVTMSDAQAQLFKAWWDEVLISGSLSFECQLKTDLGVRLYRARFTDIYQGPELVGRSSWRFRCPLELIERPVLPPGWVTVAPEYILGSDLLDIAMNEKWPRA
jgi:hypothetical protein